MSKQTAEVVFGGTFDPVHEGHLAIVRSLVSQLGVLVRILPAYVPGHRGACTASPEHRLAMLELATKNMRSVVIDRFEYKTGRTVPTIEVLRHLRQTHSPLTPIFFVLGQDALADLPNWVESEHLLDLAHFLVVPRAGLRGEVNVSVARYPRLQKIEDNMTASGGIFRLDFNAIDVSATRVRAQLTEGKPVEDLPLEVQAYISQHKLYQGDEAGRP